MYSAEERKMMETVGLRIVESRQRLGWRQEDLAQKIGTTQRQISRYERGISTPSLPLLRDLADALNVSIDWLVGRTEDTGGMKWSAEAAEAARVIDGLNADDARTVLGIVVFTANELRLRSARRPEN